MRVWLAVMLCAVLGCGDKPAVVPEVPPDADPWRAVDERDATSVQLDLRLLRAHGWMPLVKGWLLRGAEPPAGCAFDPWTEADRMAFSLDAGGVLVGAVTSPVRVEDAACSGGLALGGLVARGGAHQRFGEVVVFGDRARIDASRARLAGPTRFGADTMLVVRGASPQAGIERITFTLRGDEAGALFEMNLVPTKRDDIDAAQLGLAMKARLRDLGESLRELGAETEPLASALAAPAVKLTARGVAIAVEVTMTPELRGLLVERGDTLFSHHPEGCERIVAGIFARCP